MNKGKMLAYVLLMLCIGAVFFSGLGALVNWRVGSPLARPASQPLRHASGDPIEALSEGVRQSLTIAHTELKQHHRTEAVKALDAAKRAADVGRHAPTDFTNRFEAAYRSTEHARASLQDGEASRAQEILAAAAGSLPLPATGRTSEAPAPRIAQPGSLQDYAGAHVINAQGVRIGEVEKIQSGIATLRIGAPNDVLGFIDLGGGKLIHVPVERLVFGKRKALGSTMVALPVFSAMPDQVEQEVAMPTPLP